MTANTGKIATFSSARRMTSSDRLRDNILSVLDGGGGGGGGGQKRIQEWSTE